VIIDFSVGEIPAQFTRDQVTGRAEVRTPGGTLVLGSPFNPLTHFSLRLTRKWQFTIDGKNVVIEKKRPLFLAGLRPHQYKVFVEGRLVAEASGV